MSTESLVIACTVITAIAICAGLLALYISKRK